ncbi:MAG: ATP-binding protein [Capsulimonas sp.]|uniref:ATP-binding protein n=1 Tax=Capsulimonas sp. TaxID=2494211 RepID=UPI0032671FCC
MSVEYLKDIQPSPQSPIAGDDKASGNTRSNRSTPKFGFASAGREVRPQTSAEFSRRYKAPSKVLASVRDIFINPSVGSLLTLGLLALCTWWILRIREFIVTGSPQTILYLIPVAIAAAFLGVRGGVAASFAALILTRIYFFNDNQHGWALVSLPKMAESVQSMALLLGMLAIALVTGRLRKILGYLHDSHLRLEEVNERLASANQRLIESEEQRRSFNSEVLLAVTGGKLNLVDRAEILPRDLAEAQPVRVQSLRTPLDASCLRRDLHQIAMDLHMDINRTADLLTSVSEAATNAIKHGGGGGARVWLDGPIVSVLIDDNGTGIAPVHLARATLEKGYSTRISLGMGFHLMLEAADNLTFSTSSEGTSILLQISSKPKISEEDAILAKYMRV